MDKQTKRIRFGGKLLLLIALAVVLLAGSVWGVSAKYVYGREWTGVAKASEFYFTSNFLTPTPSQYTLNPGYKSTIDLDVTLHNFDGLLVSELDIYYEVTVACSDDSTVNWTLSDTDKKFGTSKETATIQLKDLKPGKIYTVTAVGYSKQDTGERGYEQTLSATFVVKKNVFGMYKETEIENDYVLLSVWNEGQAGTVTITVPKGLIPDATDDALEGLYTDGEYDGTTFNLTLQEYESQTYRFFRTPEYDGNVITVTFSGQPLAETDLD